MIRNSQNTSGAVTDKPEQALSCAAREVIMRKCPALFSLCFCASVAILLSGCVMARKKGRTTHELFLYKAVCVAGVEPTSILIQHEIWRDEWTGGGRAFLADPKASELVSNHTNQIALGGSSSLQIGSFESSVNTNAVKIISDAASQLAADVISKTLTPKP